MEAVNAPEVAIADKAIETPAAAQATKTPAAAQATKTPASDAKKGKQKKQASAQETPATSDPEPPVASGKKIADKPDESTKKDLLAHPFLGAIIANASDVLEHACNFAKAFEVELNGVNLGKLAKMLAKISQVLNVQFNVRTNRQDSAKKWIEEVITTTFGKMLMDLAKEHHHESGTAACPFHPESLISHLLLAMLHAFQVLVKESTDEAHDRYMFLTCLTALLHDIGKVSCKVISSSRISFPLHGEMGALLIMRACNVEFMKLFTSLEFATIARSVCVHMCGYHDTDPNNAFTKYKWCLLSLEHEEVKKTLCALSIADSRAATGNNKEAIENVESSRDAFATHIGDLKGGLAQLLEMTKHGVLIFLRGQSGSGKSTLAKMLKEAYGDRIEIVSRDDEILNMANAAYGRVMTYADSYKLYEKEKLASIINAIMAAKINMALGLNKVVIVDTMTALYPDIDKMVSANKAFRIGVFCVRNIPIVGTNCHERLGVDVDTQLKLSSSSSVWSALPNSVLDTFQGLNKLRSLPSMPAGNKEDCTTDMNFTVVMNENGMTGVDTLKDIMDMVVSVMPPVLELPNVTESLADKSICDYLSYMLNIPGMDWDTLKDQLRIAGFTSKECIPGSGLWLLSYDDGMCHVWSDKWMREMRGTIVHINDKIVTLVRSCLQRGAEIAAFAGYKTQDGAHETFCRFDKIQQELMHKIASGSGPIDAYLSSKADGVLVNVTVYYKDSELGQFMLQLIKQYGDEFAKAVLGVCDSYGFFIVIGTQRTMMVHKDLLDYIVTALFDYCDPSKSPEEIFAELGHTFVSKIAKLWDRCNMNIAFELICKDRTTYKGVVHNELAISQSKSACLCLGIYYVYNSVPHFKIEELIEYAGFSQPAYWRITSVEQAFVLLNTLIKVGFNQITAEEFYNACKPSNICEYDKSQPHCEGFIVYYAWNGQYDYSKLKTWVYYVVHKFHESNAEKLEELYKAGARFPLVVAWNNHNNGMKAFLEKFVMHAQKLYEDLFANGQIEIPIDLKASLEKIKDPVKHMTAKINNCAIKDPNGVAIQVPSGEVKKFLAIQAFDACAEYKNVTDTVRNDKAPKIFEKLPFWDTSNIGSRIDSLLLTKNDPRGLLLPLFSCQHI